MHIIKLYGVGDRSVINLVWPGYHSWLDKVPAANEFAFNIQQ